MFNLSPLLASGLEYWLKIRGDREIPQRTELEPLDIPALLPNLCLVEVLGPNQFRYRLLGNVVISNLTRNLTGQMIEDDMLKGRGREVIFTYQSVVDHRAPVVTSGRAMWAKYDWMQFTSLNLPMTSDGQGIDIMLSLVEFDSTLDRPIKPALSPQHEVLTSADLVEFQTLLDFRRSVAGDRKVIPFRRLSHLVAVGA